VRLISQKAEVPSDLVQNKRQALQQLIQAAGYEATFSHVVKPGDEHSLELKFSGHELRRVRGQDREGRGQAAGHDLSAGHSAAQQGARAPQATGCTLGYSAQVALENQKHPHGAHVHPAALPRQSPT
jgi:hypothetical protein